MLIFVVLFGMFHSLYDLNAILKVCQYKYRFGHGFQKGGNLGEGCCQHSILTKIPLTVTLEIALLNHFAHLQFIIH